MRALRKEFIIRLYLATTISVDMYVDLLCRYIAILLKRTEPNFLRPLLVGANASTFRYKCRRAQRHRAANSETIVIITLSMIPHIDLLWHMGCSGSLCKFWKGSSSCQKEKLKKSRRVRNVGAS
jgi:hypothetical protein